MRVGFGCTVLAKGLKHGGVDGIGSYTKELGGRLCTDAAIDLVPVSFGVPISGNFPLPGSPVKLLGRYPPMAAVCAVSPLSFPAQAFGGALDLFHATDHLVPKYSDFPVLATLMDAIPLSHPEWVRTRFSGLKKRLWRRTAQWADHVLTISEHSKNELSMHFGILPEKISVIPLGVDERYFERFDANRKNEVLKRLSLPQQFYLFVGTLQPRKNVERILDAHAALPLRRQQEIPLVIVGREGWGCAELVARLRDQVTQGRVYWLDYLPDADVRSLMQSAQALVFASLHEGFGLPVAEAFASGLPVIASNTTSLPEVARDAALLINPLDVGEISDAMRQVVEVPGLAQQLIVAGELRARELNWSACTQKTLDIYRRVLAG